MVHLDLAAWTVTPAQASTEPVSASSMASGWSRVGDYLKAWPSEGIQLRLFWWYPCVSVCHGRRFGESFCGPIRM